MNLATLAAAYTNPSRVAPLIPASEIEVDDIIFLRSPDPFDSWYQLYHVEKVTPAKEGVHLIVKRVAWNGTTNIDPRFGDRRYINDKANRVYHAGHAWEIAQ